MTGDGGSLVPRKTITAVIMLTVVFTVLKLTGVISWAWWLVLAPLWGAAGAGAYVGLAVAVGFALRRWPPS